MRSPNSSHNKSPLNRNSLNLQKRLQNMSTAMNMGKKKAIQVPNNKHLQGKNPNKKSQRTTFGPTNHQFSLLIYSKLNHHNLLIKTLRHINLKPNLICLMLLEALRNLPEQRINQAAISMKKNITNITMKFDLSTFIILDYYKFKFAS